ncbi:MAG TPA: inorganic pyrophosphatase [Bacteroidales bacterium]|jgi:inorganic pyrophosphatase|nr:inorganic pyrophosphatase [Bacteroidales bacterium]HQQ02418.1 inorganic pyrophosphatase [Bacteroidales bacterium]
MQIATSLMELMGLRYKSHPWHGVEIGEKAPEIVTAYIEMVPTDTVKYEVDKATGYLRIDRPQRYSSMVPALYGFIPQTFCGDEVAALSLMKTGRENIQGDGDPLDICILTEKVISHGDILVSAIPIGGLRMIDNSNADDKIIAVLENDLIYGDFKNIEDLPTLVIERIKHYFLTYKDMPGLDKRNAEITHVYDAEEARDLIVRSMKDYNRKFENLSRLISGY